MKNNTPDILHPNPISGMENKFKEGEIVYERIHPSKKLVVSSYVHGIYYCKVKENRYRKALVYFERELMADSMLSYK